jgi:hypothetical protein
MSGFEGSLPYGGATIGNTYLHTAPSSQDATTKASMIEAFNGPPSPDASIAYHDQLRRASVVTNRTRSNTATSASSSFRSAESGNTACTDHPSLSRNSSGKSTSKSSAEAMNGRSERPDSNLWSKSIFARRLKSKHESLGAAPGSMGGVGGLQAGSARAHYYGRSQSGRISFTPRWKAILTMIRCGSTT